MRWDPSLFYDFLLRFLWLTVAIKITRQASKFPQRLWKRESIAEGLLMAKDKEKEKEKDGDKKRNKLQKVIELLDAGWRTVSMELECLRVKQRPLRSFWRCGSRLPKSSLPVLNGVIDFPRRNTQSSMCGTYRIQGYVYPRTVPDFCLVSESTSNEHGHNRPG